MSLMPCTCIGFYYRVDAFNRGGHVKTYSGDARPMVVTQRIAQGEAFDMSWSPERAGQWGFPLPYAPAHDSSDCAEGAGPRNTTFRKQRRDA
jgi:hypothetical protein